MTQVVIGDINADFNLAINSSFTYKNFSSYLLIDWKQGGDVYNQTQQWIIENCASWRWSIWKAEADKVPAGYYSGLYNINATTDYFVEDGSYIKLRELNLNIISPKMYLEFVLKTSNWV